MTRNSISTLKLTSTPGLILYIPSEGCNISNLGENTFREIHLFIFRVKLRRESTAPVLVLMVKGPSVVKAA